MQRGPGADVARAAFVDFLTVLPSGPVEVDVEIAHSRCGTKQTTSRHLGGQEV
jgi:hypothetical protein